MEGLAWHLIEFDINLEEGMALIEKALKLAPETYNIVDTWGWGLYKSGRCEEALMALHKAQDLRGLYDPLIVGQTQAVEKVLASTSQSYIFVYNTVIIYIYIILIYVLCKRNLNLPRLFTERIQVGKRS